MKTKKIMMVGIIFLLVIAGVTAFIYLEGDNIFNVKKLVAEEIEVGNITITGTQTGGGSGGFPGVKINSTNYRMTVL